MQTVAQAWLIYRITGSGALLGLLGFVGQIPIFLLSPLAGLVADRWPRRAVVIATQTASMLLAFILAVFALYGSLHHQRVAWGLFVLPLVLVLVLLAWLKVPEQTASGSYWEWLQGTRFWGTTHGILITGTFQEYLPGAKSPNATGTFAIDGKCK